MSLHYLSGDSDLDVINGKKRKKRRAAKKAKRKEKKAVKKGRRKEKKKIRKARPRKKRFVKIAGAPVRAAFLTVTSLNLLKTGTKLARVWTKPGGKAKLLNWWKNFGGKSSALQKAISKGSKQRINADEMGVATAAVIASATAALIAVAPIIKQFAAQGSESEAAEFDSGINQGKQDMANDPSLSQGESENFPEGKDVAAVKDGDDDDTTEGSSGLLAASLAVGSMPLYLAIPASIACCHLWAVRYSPYSFRANYKAGIDAIKNKFFSLIPKF